MDLMSLKTRFDFVVPVSTLRMSRLGAERHDCNGKGRDFRNGKGN